MCWLSLWRTDNEIKLCLLRTYCGPQTLVWEPLNYITKDVRNSSNYISVQPLKNENSNKDLLFALCCDWLSSVRVGYNKHNRIIGVQNFRSRYPPFATHEKSAYHVCVTVRQHFKQRFSGNAPQRHSSQKPFALPGQTPPRQQFGSYRYSLAPGNSRATTNVHTRNNPQCLITLNPGSVWLL